MGDGTKPECSEQTIPRSCADAFREGAERMTRLETKADAHGEQLTTISNDVAEIKELVARGRGAVALGRVVAAGFWAVIGFIGSLLLRK